MTMIMANVADLKARLSEYIDRAVRGERIVICRHNKPVAELRSLVESRAAPRPIGPLPGRPTFDVPPAFFEPLTEAELRQWEGGAADPLTPSSGAPPRSRASRAAEPRASYSVKRPRRRGRQRG